MVEKAPHNEKNVAKEPPYEDKESSKKPPIYKKIKKFEGGGGDWGRPPTSPSPHPKSSVTVTILNNYTIELLLDSFVVLCVGANVLITKINDSHSLDV